MATAPRMMEEYESDNIANLVYITSHATMWERLSFVSIFYPKMKGYNPQCLLNPLTEAEQALLTCPECEGILRDPVIMKQHDANKTVCKSCAGNKIVVSDWQQGKDSINKLNAKCPLEARGCNWRGKLDQIERHLSIYCSRLLIDCKLRCQQVLLRKDEEEHRSDKCERRKIPCKHCGDNLMTFQREEHYQTCPEMEVTCPNHCGRFDKIKRKLLESHLSIDCPLNEITCEYARFGCTTSVKRRDMSAHSEREVHKHLALVTQIVLKQETQIADLFQKIEGKQYTL